MLVNRSYAAWNLGWQLEISIALYPAERTISEAYLFSKPKWVIVYNDCLCIELINWKIGRILTNLRSFLTLKKIAHTKGVLPLILKAKFLLQMLNINLTWLRCFSTPFCLTPLVFFGNHEMTLFKSNRWQKLPCRRGHYVTTPSRKRIKNTRLARSKVFVQGLFSLRITKVLEFLTKGKLQVKSTLR